MDSIQANNLGECEYDI